MSLGEIILFGSVVVSCYKIFNATGKLIVKLFQWHNGYEKYRVSGEERISATVDHFQKKRCECLRSLYGYFKKEFEEWKYSLGTGQQSTRKD
jgi:hypothetical protein